MNTRTAPQRRQNQQIGFGDLQPVGVGLHGETTGGGDGVAANTDDTAAEW